MRLAGTIIGRILTRGHLRMQGWKLYQEVLDTTIYFEPPGCIVCRGDDASEAGQMLTGRGWRAAGQRCSAGAWSGRSARQSGWPPPGWPCAHSASPVAEAKMHVSFPDPAELLSADIMCSRWDPLLLLSSQARDSGMHDSSDMAHTGAVCILCYFAPVSIL